MTLHPLVRATDPFSARSDRRGRAPTLAHDSRLRRVALRALVLVALLPLSALLAERLGRLVNDPVVGLYGFTVLASLCILMFLAFAEYRDPAVERAGRGTPSVSCMVAVRNELGQIESCIRSVLASDYQRLELIVVDDASTDGTDRLLADLSDQLPFKLIRLGENVGKKAALTRAAREAKGSIFVFTDSDCRLEPDAIRRCVDALTGDPGLGAVSGHARALNADASLLTRVQDVWYDGQFGVAKAAESVFGSVTCVSGPLAVFRREAIENYFPAWQHDRFAGREFRFATDRQMTAYVLGQQWIGNRLKEQYAGYPYFLDRDHPARRWRVGYVRSARVWTNVPVTVRSFVRQQVRWKKSLIRSTFFTGRFAWRLGPIPAAMFYGHIAFAFFAPLIVLRHLVLAPADGAWLLPVTYMAGVCLKGALWAVAYKVQNPRCDRWIYRPVMSILSTLALPWLLPYSIATVRKMVWSRG